MSEHVVIPVDRAAARGTAPHGAAFVVAFLISPVVWLGLALALGI